MQAEVPVRAEDYALTRKLQWLALSQTPGIGAGRGRKLVEHFGKIDRLFAASLTELEACGLPAAAAQSLALGKSLELAAAEYDRVREMGAALWCWATWSSPTGCWKSTIRPSSFTSRETQKSLDQYGIAVIGTRHPTPYGMGMAERLACDLAARGLIIISGMARGVDTAAHRVPWRPTDAPWRSGAPESTKSTPRRTRSSATRFWTLAEPLSASFRWVPFRRRRTFQFATGSSVACRLACWCWRRANSAEPG